ncbi:MAG: hypothetical protein RL518_2514 [Pseudomonadota bacterium]
MIGIVCAVGVTAVMAYAPVAFGDDSLAELQRHVDRLRSQQQGASNAETQRVFDKARREAEAMKQAIDARQPIPTSVARGDTTPRTHVRGGDGIPFPKPEQVYLDPHPPISFRTENKMVDTIPTPTYSKPPRCESSETKREERLIDDGAKGETTLFETLYLPEEFVPVDVSEVYGTKVRLYPYGAASGTGVYIRMRTDAVPCVPYRIRITTRAWYYDRGNNALKNYDKQPGGRGEYSKWIQQKLFLGK